MTTWTDIEDSVRLDEVLDALGVNVISITKGEHWASCPLPSHPGADASPSFSVNEDNLLWNCFTCDDGGSLPTLVIRIEELQDSDYETAWAKAVDWLIPFSDGEVSEDDDAGFLEQVDKYFKRGEERKRYVKPTMPYFADRVIDLLEPAPLDILAKWNITSEETVEHFRLKYDPERHRIKGDKDYTAPALVIPHFFNGKLVGFQERWLADDRPKWVPKYTNSDDFPKSTTLYDWDNVREEAQGSPAIVVESAMTRIRLWELGYAGVATFGASVTDEQVRLLRALRGGVILSFDNDPDYLNQKGKWVMGSGRKAMLTYVEKLADYIPVEFLPFVDKDKGDLADLEDREVHMLVERREPVFAALTPSKSRKQQV